MKLNARHVYPCSTVRFWQMFWDPEYDRMLTEQTGLDRTDLWNRVEGDVRTWRARYEPARELPAAAQKVLGASKLVYEQESRLEQTKGELQWAVEPMVMRDRVTARGSMLVQPHPTGCERVVEGEISVRVLLVGGAIEKAVSSQLAEGYEQTHRIGLAWLETYGTDETPA